MDLKSILSENIILYKHLAVLMFSKTYEFLFSRKNLYYVVSEGKYLNTILSFSVQHSAVDLLLLFTSGLVISHFS